MEEKARVFVLNSFKKASYFQVAYLLFSIVIAFLIKFKYISPSTKIPDVLYEIIMGSVNIRFAFKLMLFFAIVVFLAYLWAKLRNLKLKNKTCNLIERVLLFIFTFFVCSKFWTYSTFVFIFHFIPRWFQFPTGYNISIWLTPLGILLAFSLTFLFSMFLSSALGKFKEDA